MKDRSHSSNTGPLVHPLSLTVACVPGGAPSERQGSIRFLAKIINCGTKDPAALQQQITVVVLPRSVLVM